MPPRLTVPLGDLQEAFDRVYHSGQFTEGYYVRALEDAVSNWSGLHAVAFNSAGSGLFAMMRMAKVALPLPTGLSNYAAVCPNTFFATGAMAKEAGYSLIGVDCNRDDFSMSHEDLRRHSNVGTVIMTHVGGGLGFDYELISDWCAAQGTVFFEDAAHAFGVGEEGTCAGSMSDGAVFSLYPTKAIPAGEGGIVVTKHRAFADALQEFRNYGKYSEGGQVRYRGRGFNLRMSEWDAAVALLQFRRRDDILASRQESAEWLRLILPPILEYPPGCTNWYKYAVNRREAEDRGLKRRVGSIYSSSDQLTKSLGMAGTYPNCDWVAQNHVCLPIDEPEADDMDLHQFRNWLRVL